MNTKRFSIATAIVLAGCYAASDRYIVFNAPPAVTILLPAEGSVFEEDEGIVFQGRVSDNQPVDTLLIVWESSIAGAVASLDVPDPDGYIELATASLPPGDHVITLRATDDDGDQGEARVTIHIEHAPEHPSIEVIQPQNNGQALENFPYEFLVRVDDHQTPVQELIVDSTWQLDGNGPIEDLCLMVPDTTGLASCSDSLPNGRYLLSFTVTDLDGFTSSRNVVFDVVAEGDYDGDGDGFTPNTGDCNDDIETVHPGAPELCDGLDNDCLGTTQIDQGSDCWDDDSDNYCERGFNCANASGVGADCNDLQPFIHPNATEIANGIDDDCDGLVDDGTSKWDDDLDGYCEAPPCVNVAGSTASSPSDCNDNNNMVKPTTTTVPWSESCATAYDDNCNGLTNEQNALGATRYYRDQDGDGYYPPANQNSSEMWCAPQPPFSGTLPNDCYDQNALAHPFPANSPSPWRYTHRGDTQFDYDCDGSGNTEKEFPTTSGCVLSTSGWPWDWACNATGSGGAGWTGSVPACGNEGNFVDECSYDWASCLIICGFTCIVSPDFGDCTSCAATQCLGQGTCDPDGPQQKLQGCR